MFDWVLNTSEYYNNFFSWRFQIKVNEFFKFFSTINFSCQYLPETKAYLEPSRTFYNGAFSRNIFFSRIHKKTPVLESNFNKVTGVYPATSLKKGLQHRCFLVNFARYLTHLFYRTPPGDYVCSTEKIYQ